MILSDSEKREVGKVWGKVDDQKMETVGGDMYILQDIHVNIDIFLSNATRIRGKSKSGTAGTNRFCSVSLGKLPSGLFGVNCNAMTLWLARFIVSCSVRHTQLLLNGALSSTTNERVLCTFSACARPATCPERPD